MILWLFIFHITIYQINAQQFFTGKIIDDKTLPVPYALIYYPNTEIGAMSDENGNFKLKYISDTTCFKISLLGYTDLTTSLFKNNFNNQFIINAKSVSLNEIEVKPSKKKKYKLYLNGEIDNNRSYNVCDSILPYNFELGLKFETENTLYFDGVTAKISNESEVVTPFRFNLYIVDTIQNSIIKKHSWICENYKTNKSANIYFDNRIIIQPGKYILTIEWITSQFNTKNLFKIKLKNKSFDCYGQSINMAYYKKNIGVIKKNNKVVDYNRKHKNGYLGPAIDLLIEK